MTKPDEHQTASCYHCSEPIPPQLELTLLIDGVKQPMCCHGCLAVSEYILTSGLRDYYRYRTETADTPDNLSDDFSMYDAQNVFCAFSKADGDSWETRLSIGGLHCAACCWLIEKRLASIPGVEQANVHLQKNIASVRWNPDLVPLGHIFSAIHKLGYTALPYSASNSEQLLQRDMDKLLGRIGLAGIGMMQVVMVAIALYAGDFQGMSDSTRNLLRYFSLVLATPILIYSAQPFFYGALRSLRNQQLNMDVPVAIALAASYIASLYATLLEQQHVYFDTIAMFTFLLLLSRYLQLLAQKRQSRQNTLAPLTARQPATNDTVDVIWTPVTQLQPGDRVIVQPGETVPVDGTITKGRSSIDESTFSGEFQPRDVSENSTVMAGTRNIDGTLEIINASSAANYKISYIDKLLERALHNKPQLSQIADTIAAHFILLVLIISAVSFAYWSTIPGQNAFLIALAVLIVSCPCALSLATPATYTSSLYGLHRLGVFMSDASALERLHKVTHVLFDKTGTLTAGKPSINAIDLYGKQSRHDVIAIAAALETHSSHPIATAFKQQTTYTPASEVNVESGSGISGKINGQLYRIGSAQFCAADSPDLKGNNKSNDNDIVVYLNQGSSTIARFALQDTIRPEAASLVNMLRQRGIAVSILSGDREQPVAAIADALAIQDFHSRCSAEDKLAHIKQLQRQRNVVMMVGDGVNDAPIIAAADLSVAMTQASDLTRAQAQVQLLNNSLRPIEQLFAKAQQNRRILLQNFTWALSYNLTALPLSALGLVPPYLAALGMSLSSIIVVLNAGRAASNFGQAEQRGGNDTKWPLFDGSTSHG